MTSIRSNCKCLSELHLICLAENTKLGSQLLALEQDPLNGESQILCYSQLKNKPKYNSAQICDFSGVTSRLSRVVYLSKAAENYVI